MKDPNCSHWQKGFFRPPEPPIQVPVPKPLRPPEFHGLAADVARAAAQKQCLPALLAGQIISFPCKILDQAKLAGNEPDPFTTSGEIHLQYDPDAGFVFIIETSGQPQATCLVVNHKGEVTSCDEQIELAAEEMLITGEPFRLQNPWASPDPATHARELASRSVALWTKACERGLATG